MNKPYICRDCEYVNFAFSAKPCCDCCIGDKKVVPEESHSQKMERYFDELKDHGISVRAYNADSIHFAYKDREMMLFHFSNDSWELWMYHPTMLNKTVMKIFIDIMDEMEKESKKNG